MNAGLKKIIAARGSDGSYAFVYIPASRVVTIDLTKITGGRAKAWWYDPRTGKARPIGEFPTSGEHDFEPPDSGEMIDWVLVLDDATRHYPPPGTR